MAWDPTKRLFWDVDPSEKVVVMSDLDTPTFFKEVMVHVQKVGPVMTVKDLLLLMCKDSTALKTAPQNLKHTEYSTWRVSHNVKVMLVNQRQGCLASLYIEGGIHKILFNGNCTAEVVTGVDRVFFETPESNSLVTRLILAAPMPTLMELIAGADILEAPGIKKLIDLRINGLL